MADTALITGASGGIGREFAILHAAQGGDLIVVARRREALGLLQTELQDKYSINVSVIVADLAQPSAAQDVYRQVQELDVRVDYLINNAGMGGHDLFHEREWQKEQTMIRLNVMSLTELTHLFLPDMVARKSGKILNVASTAAFLPGPLQAVYYATKAYVLSFSQAIAEELSSDNITVTALCPGPVDTGFVKAGDLEGVEVFEQAASAQEVAKIGYKAMLKGKLVVIDDWKLRLMLNWLLPFLPRKMMLRMSRQAMEKK